PPLQVVGADQLHIAFFRLLRRSFPGPAAKHATKDKKQSRSCKPTPHTRPPVQDSSPSSRRLAARIISFEGASRPNEFKEIASRHSARLVRIFLLRADRG